MENPKQMAAPAAALRAPAAAYFPPAPVRRRAAPARQSAAHGERAKLLHRVAVLGENRRAAEAWLGKPLPGFGGQTPEDLLREGRAAWVHEYLDGVLAGVHA